MLIDIVFTRPAAQAGPLREYLLQRRMERRKDLGEAFKTLYNNITCKELVQLSRMHKGAVGKVAPTYTESYGPDPLQSLDVYVPPQKGAGHRPRPIIVMVHGGAWCVGDKDRAAVTSNKIKRWLPKGFVFVSVNYRMLPDHADVLAQAGDVATAIAYVQAHAAQWGGNASEVIVMGHSAGAHLVSLLSSEPRLAARYGAKPWLGTVSLDSAVLNVSETMRRQHPAFYGDAFGQDPEFWEKLSPMRHLSPASLPWFGVCSTRRKDSCPQAHAYSREAVRYGVRAGVLPEDLSHKQINAELGESNAYTQAVESFMASLNPDVKAHLASNSVP